MGKTEILMMLGGLALFLYGMQMMSSGLEAAAGAKMKTILEKLTSNRIKGVLAGAGITAVIQSSSATTVMVVGFVSAGLMTLNQAVWVIMGANIGTTITGQMIALDVSEIAPLITFIGVVMIVFFKGEEKHHIGNIVAGLGVLFIGMKMMSTAMEPLQNSELFTSIVTKFDNPLVGILAGAVFTAIIQSSSASVGILQALAASGIIGLPQAVYVLFGQNIGTCITAVLASIGTKINAKRTTIIHLMFNIIGTIMFTLICMWTPLVSFIESLTPGNPLSQIANMHTLFNITTTLVLLPFGNYMAKFATKILPGVQKDEEMEHKLKYITNFEQSKGHQIGLISISISQVEQEIFRMLKMAEKSVEQCFNLVNNYNKEEYNQIVTREEYIDYLNSEICKYIGRVIVLEMSAEDSDYISSCYKITGNIERIADHAMNLADYGKTIKNNGLELSGFAHEEIKEMEEITLKSLENIRQGFERKNNDVLKKAAQLEQKTDDLSEDFRNRQIKRLQEKRCSAEVGILYSEMVTDFERIGDHTLNIAEAIVKSTTK